MGAATLPRLHLPAPCVFLSIVPIPRIPPVFPRPFAATAGTQRRDPLPWAARGTPLPLPDPFPWLSRPCPPIHRGGPSAGPLGNASRGGSAGNIKQVQPLQSPFERGQSGACSRHGEPGQAQWLLGRGRGDPQPISPSPCSPPCTWSPRLPLCVGQGGMGEGWCIGG